MTKLQIYLIASFGFLMLLSCKEDEVVGTPEQVLPGHWNIESVQLNDYNNGITLGGVTYYNDTILYNVGTIQMAPFSIDSLEPKDLEKHHVACILEISGGQMQVSINSLFLNMNRWLTAIRYNGQDGYISIDTPVEELYSSTHIFNNMYTLEILDNDHMQFRTSNVEENHLITLIRR